MKKNLGFIIPSAIIFTGIGSILANVIFIAGGDFRYFYDFSILNINSEISHTMLMEHSELTFYTAHAIFILFALSILLSAVILVLHKSLTVIQLRVLAIIAGFLFSLRATVWASTVSATYQDGFFQNNKIQQDAYLHFMVGKHFENYKFFLAYFTSGLLMFALLAAQIAWTFHIEDKPEVVARRKSLEMEKAASRLSTSPAKPVQNPTPPQPISTPSSRAPKQLSEELSELTRLHESGALTDGEFTAAKNRILGLK